MSFVLLCLSSPGTASALARRPAARPAMHGSGRVIRAIPSVQTLRAAQRSIIL